MKRPHGMQHPRELKERTNDSTPGIGKLARPIGGTLHKSKTIGRSRFQLFSSTALPYPRHKEKPKRQEACHREDIDVATNMRMNRTHSGGSDVKFHSPGIPHNVIVIDDLGKPTASMKAAAIALPHPVSEASVQATFSAKGGLRSEKHKGSNAMEDSNLSKFHQSAAHQRVGTLRRSSPGSSPPSD
eukprot:6479678-Amphidinium_carterae.3